MKVYILSTYMCVGAHSRIAGIAALAAGIAIFGAGWWCWWTLLDARWRFWRFLLGAILLTIGYWLIGWGLSFADPVVFHPCFPSYVE